MASSPILFRGAPLRLHQHHHNLNSVAGVAFFQLRRPRCAASTSTADARTTPEGSSCDLAVTIRVTTAAADDSLSEQKRVWEHEDYRKWKDVEEVILKDIEPVVSLVKYILHSDRYLDGEQLVDEDAKVVVERLLVYHPSSENKIGCGIDSVIVDRHPQFRNSRCLFVVRTDGEWVDFSYQKCLRAYIRDKYPIHAERFIREHFKRGGSWVKKHFSLSRE